MDQQDKDMNEWLGQRTPEDMAMRLLLANQKERSWYPHQYADQLARPLVVTPFLGHYEEHAGWVIVLNGSPPHGVALCMAHTNESWIKRYGNVNFRQAREHGKTIVKYLESLGLTDWRNPVIYQQLSYFVNGEIQRGAPINIIDHCWRFRGGLSRIKKELEP